MSRFSSTEVAAGYVAAIIDGEGCVTYATSDSGQLRRSVRISNTDPDIVDACVEACAMIGVVATVHGGKAQRSGEKPVWTVYVGGEDLSILNEAITLQSQGKRERLEACANHSVKTRRRKSSRFPVSEVKQMLSEGMSLNDIGEYFGVTRQAVAWWLNNAQEAS